MVAVATFDRFDGPERLLPAPAEPEALPPGAPVAVAADDDPFICELVALRLGQLGYRVLTAHDGQTALRLATENRPAVAVLDVSMPGLDGLEVTRRLRAATATRDTVVILLTARSQEVDVERGFDAGADDYIRKPFSARELRESVQRSAAERVLRETEAKARRTAALEGALGRVATAVATEATPRTIFGLVAEESGRLLDAEVAAVVRVEGEATTGRIVGAWARTQAALAGVPLALNGEDAISVATRTGRLASAPLTAIANASRNGEAMPIVVAGRRWGALAVAWAGDGGHADAEESLARFAGLIALAVGNAESRTALATLASTDGLTGLANQRTFHERLATDVARARRHGRPLALVLFDLDHFKAVNDAHGHEAGDRVLAEAARRLEAQCRTGELVARAGGEEFAWILPETNAVGAYAAAERARVAIAATPFPIVGTITASAGVATVDGASDAGELFRAADTALYRAKEAGRDTSVLHAPDAGDVSADAHMGAVGWRPAA
jgi:diguanylate cyclase (GGDEF)-like protein